MIFSTPPASIQDLITLPSARRPERWLPLLDQVMRFATDQRAAFCAAANSPDAQLAYTDIFESIDWVPGHDWAWGQLFAAALFHENSLAAEAILMVSVASPTGSFRFLEHTTKALHANGRMDLFRPALILIYGFCSKLWCLDAPRRNRAPRAWRTQLIPQSVGLTQADRRATRNPHLRCALRSAYLWWDMGAQLSGLLVGRPGNDEVELSEMFPVLLNAMETLPALRPFVAPCLVSFVRALTLILADEGLLPGTLYDAKRLVLAQLTASARPLLSLTTDGESAALLRRMGDFRPATFVGPSDLFILVDQLAQSLIGAHAHLSCDDWFRRGLPGEIDLPGEEYAGCHRLRQEFLCDRAGLGAKKGSRLKAHRAEVLASNQDDRKSRLFQMVGSYDNVAAWVGPTQGHQLLPDTAAALELLLTSAFPSSSPSSLRSTLDKAILSRAPKKRRTAFSVPGAGPPSAHASTFRTL